MRGDETSEVDMRLGPWEIAMILLIVLLLFGATRLPKLARSLREARDEFQKGADEDPSEEQKSPAPPASGDTPPTEQRSTDAT